MNFKLIPYTSLGNILARQFRDDLRRSLGGVYEEFFKTALSSVPTDDFIDSAFHVYYDDQFNCKGVEVFKPNDIEVEGVNLMTTRVFKIKKHLESRNYTVNVTSTGFDCDDLGISIYCPEIDSSEEALVEAVYIRLIRKDSN